MLYNSQKEELDILRSIHIKSLLEERKIEPSIGTPSTPVQSLKVSVQSPSEVDIRRQIFQLKFS